jgi:outer membrane lipoprotein-sorting protein
MLVRVTVLHRNPGLLLPILSALVASLAVAGCAASHTTVVKPSGPPVQLQTATKGVLIERYNSLAASVRSVNLGVTITLTAGSAYTGVIKQYHQVNGFILAERPSDIRVIGQAPIVGTKIFDMVSDAETFRISMPTEHKFITGPTKLERPSSKPIENLRPQHLLGAIFWDTLPARDPVLLEEAGPGERYYVLTAIRRVPEGTDDSGTDWVIAQKVWIDRADLSVARRQTYDEGGQIGSDIAYSKWDTFGDVHYPRQVALMRPGNDYELEIGITKATFNETITADRFELKQPEGEELVRVGEDSVGTKSEAASGATQSDPTSDSKPDAHSPEPKN